MAIVTAIASFVFLLAMVSLSGCENTGVSGTVSYSSHFGGYPMYYDPWHRNHNLIVVPPSKPKRPNKANNRRSYQPESYIVRDVIKTN